MGELAELGAKIDSGISTMWDYYYGGWDYPAVSYETIFGYYDDTPTTAGMSGIRAQVLAAMKTLAYSGQGAVAGGEGITPEGRYGGVLRVGDHLDPWQGAARNSFDDDVKDQIQVVPQSLFVVASALVGALDAEAEVWEKARADVSTAGNKALNAIEAAQDKDSGSASFALTVLAAVGTIALSVATAGAGAAVAVAVASTAIGAASAGASAVTVDWHDTDDPAVIVKNLNDSLQQIQQHTGDRESIISTGLAGAYELVVNDLARTSTGSQDIYPKFHFIQPYLARHTGGLGSWTGA
jgi:hypothetical protein